MQEFIEGKKRRAFVLGKPGTGKSYKLFNEIIPAFLKAQPGKEVAILAFTNKAVGVIADYAAQFGFADHPLIHITTIHKFAGLRPALNESATRTKDLHLTQSSGECTEAHLVVIDEVGTVGAELGEAMDTAYYDESRFEQMLFLGDYQQLKPIEGDAYYQPEKGDPVIYLDEIKRTDKPDVSAVITELHDLIRDGSPRRYKLRESENIVKGMPKGAARDEITVIAWRNRQVQQHNALLMGRDLPEAGDELYCDTLKEVMTCREVQDLRDLPYMSIQRVTAVQADRYGNRLAKEDPNRYKMNDETDRYNTRGRFLNQIKPRIDAEGTASGRIKLLEMESDTGEVFNAVTCFGIADYRETMAALLETALCANRDLLAAYELTEAKETNSRRRKVKPIIDKNGKTWVNLKSFIDNETDCTPREAWSDEIKEYKAAWGAYATAKEILFCADFNRSRTCHSLQGSSLPTVWIDTADFNGCRNTDDANRLLYVGISRSRGKVYF